ncbi:hypothetical protein DMUE_0609 [Dictyocoela muelleri]|nr:hypothetical protein DMUE_0609 [Dictyocoela muelleri]
MRKIIDEICSKCHIYNISKDFNNKFGITKKDLSVFKPNECVAIDIKGPIKTCHFKGKFRNKYFYLLVMTDLFSRYTETSILNNITSKSIVKAFDKKWISIHGEPRSCLTDNGRRLFQNNLRIC